MACGRIHMLAGMYNLAADANGPLSVEGEVLVASYEAEQHIAHLGISDTSVCWMICGLASGYLSRAAGKDICVRGHEKHLERQLKMEKIWRTGLEGHLMLSKQTVALAELGRRYLVVEREVESTMGESMRRMLEKAQPAEATQWLLAALIEEVQGLRGELKKGCGE